MFDFSLTNPVHVSIIAIFGILIIASLIVLLIRRKDVKGDHIELEDRIKSWWIMIAIFSLAILSSPIISVIFFGLISFLAFKEFISIIPLRRIDRRVLFWAYLTIPIQYIFIEMEQYGLFIIFIPICVFFLLPFLAILAGQTEGFLKSITTISWGLMIIVFAISHAAFLMRFPESEANISGGVGLLMFLVILNQGNDVAQYIWGKLFGKHKIVPKISPNKTWEGFIGGVLTTTLIAIFIAPILTPFDNTFSIFAGLIIGFTGFLGDVTFSALKRDLKIKDSGSLIPGHGGILDRIDSLSLTAPLFFHFVRFNYY